MSTSRVGTTANELIVLRTYVFSPVKKLGNRSLCKASAELSRKITVLPIHMNKSISKTVADAKNVYCFFDL